MLLLVYWYVGVERKRNKQRTRTKVTDATSKLFKTSAAINLCSDVKKYNDDKKTNFEKISVNLKKFAENMILPILRKKAKKIS